MKRFKGQISGEFIPTHYWIGLFDGAECIVAFNGNDAEEMMEEAANVLTDDAIDLDSITVGHFRLTGVSCKIEVGGHKIVKNIVIAEDVDLLGTDEIKKEIRKTGLYKVTKDDIKEKKEQHLEEKKNKLKQSIKKLEAELKKLE